MTEQITFGEGVILHENNSYKLVLNDGYESIGGEFKGAELHLKVSPKWIKCSEKMPEPYDWVLVCDSPKGTGEPRCINIWRWDGKDWDSLDLPEGNGDCPTFSDIIYKMNDVTHWMPLPPEVKNV